MVFPNCTNSILVATTACNTTANPSSRAAAVVRALNITEKLQLLVDGNPGAPKIGLPPYEWWSEALHGIVPSPGMFWTKNWSYSYATSFAMPILLSAAFDDDLVERVATQISTEARAFSNAGHGGLDFWTPNISPYKDPRWGRGAETPGEDPFRIEGYVKALLRGLEGGDDPKFKKVIATCKHFAAYDLGSWGGIDRYNFSAVVGLQDLSEYYLPPFQVCARDSNVGSIMCSYNAVNGTPACANSYLMEDILRDHWGWTQDNNYITSDCGAIANIYQNHFYTKDNPSAAAVAYNHGTDVVCELGYITNVTGAYNEGLLSEVTVDKSLLRLYEALVRVGYFDPADATPYRSIDNSEVSNPSALALALQSAQDGIVLKGNNILPMDLQGKSIAVIGMWANVTSQMLGSYSGLPLWHHNPLYAASQFSDDVYYAGGPINPNPSTADNWTAPALEAAKKADVILYCGGIDNSIAAEGLDRYSIAWPSAQLTLIEKLGALDKPLIVAQLGDQLDDTPLLNNSKVSALLWAGYPGQDGGTALFNIITGKAAPAGRLPVTQYPASYVDAVPMTDMTLRPGLSNPGRTYRWYDKAVLPFGHGLHYTMFKASFQANGTATKLYSIADIIKACEAKKLQFAHLDLCDFASFKIGVKNAGNTTSDFVALAFLTGEYGPQPYPLKSLAAYKRLRDLKPGMTSEVSLTVTLGTLARVDDKGNTVLYPGKYKMLLDVPTQDTIEFSLSGDAMVLDKFPQPPA
ncbi:glycoside hydrolase family 3 protein [Daldinia eschscholtzii]|nr:glycoside hydrolase family 3 protein [Daldinia eschscholtzii]